MHIGLHIKQKLKEDGHSVTWFASKICCSRANVYKIFEKENIDIDLLKRICNVLNHDFFKDLSDSFSTNQTK
ncbi:MAG: helix-turn-helix transcriptional regulator [Candidatus Homeothermus sp.]|nr:helix-turn-helix transcriptional regulator [Candidatus Homeothermus sp.]